MKKFEGFNKCYIGYGNWAFLGNYTFKVVDLKNNKIIYFEEKPFVKKSQISNICLNENKNILVLLSFDGHYSIYHIDFANECIKKVSSYSESKKTYKGDVCPLWIDNEYISFLLEQNNKTLLRKLSYEGGHTDTLQKRFYFRFSILDIENQLLVKSDNKIYLYCKTNERADNFIELTKICGHQISDNSVGLFFDKKTNSLFFAENDVETIIYYALNNNKLSQIGSYKLRNLESEKIIYAYDNKITTVEIEMSDNYSRISKVNIESQLNGKLELAFDDEENELNNLSYVASVSGSWISFYSIKYDSIIILNL